MKKLTVTFLLTFIVTAWAQAQTPTPTSTLQVIQQGLSIVKTANVSIFQNGDSFTYTLNINNFGIGPQTDISIVDNLPAGIRVNSITTDISGSLNVSPALPVTGPVPITGLG